mgnify:CR=1 FL=1
MGQAGWQNVTWRDLTFGIVDIHIGQLQHGVDRALQDVLRGGARGRRSDQAKGSRRRLDPRMHLRLPGGAHTHHFVYRVVRRIARNIELHGI